MRDPEAAFAGRILEVAESCLGPEEYRVQALRELREIVGCDGAVMRRGLHWRGAETASLELEQRARLDLAYLNGEERYRQEMDRWGRLVRGARAVVDADVYSPDERRKMAYYSDVMGPASVKSVLGTPIWFRGRYVGLILFVRREGSRFPADLDRSLGPLLSAVALGELVLRPPDGALQDAASHSFRAAFASLSPRESHVARLLAEGLQSKEIASALSTSPETVRKQTLRIFQKLELHGRTQVAIAMQKAGIIASGVAEPYPAVLRTSRAG